MTTAAEAFTVLPEPLSRDTFVPREVLLHEAQVTPGSEKTAVVVKSAESC